MEDGKCAKIDVERCLVGVENDTNKCTQCVDAYYAHEQTSCELITVKNCKNSNKSLSAVKCDVCIDGFVLSVKNDACSALPEGCMTAHFEGSVQCTFCNVFEEYFATDVKGDKMVAETRRWEQVCTKSFAKIALASFLTLAMGVTFF